MDSVVSVLSWIWYNFFDRAAMFMMVLVFIGQLLTKRPFLESLMGALKAYIGYSGRPISAILFIKPLPAACTPPSSPS